MDRIRFVWKGGTTPIIPIAIALIAVLGGDVVVFKKRKKYLMYGMVTNSKYKEI